MPNSVAPGRERTNAVAQPPCLDPTARRDVRQMIERVAGFLNEAGEPDHTRIVRSFTNGCYQHIMFLGISGYVICNHVNKEILLVDPWPTSHSYWTRVSRLQFIYGGRTRRPLRDQDHQGKHRIAGLASFLRNAVNSCHYALTGILLSHTHFDHADDVVLLLELLRADTNEHSTYVDHLNRSFTINGPRISSDDPDNLPKIYCDYDTMIYFLTYGFYVDYTTIDIHGDEDFRGGRRYWYGNADLKDELDDRIRDGRRHRDHFTNSVTGAWEAVRRKYSIRPPRQDPANNSSWVEITKNGQRLHYDDSYNAYLHDPNQRLKAGQQADAFEVGEFQITPYIWDHMGTGVGRGQLALDEQSAGILQRMTAYHIKHKSAENAKSTFIIGSGGEMNRTHTGAIEDNIGIIETDLLIQAITRAHNVQNFTESINGYIDAMLNHISVNDAIIFNHFEEFVRRVADRPEFLEGFDVAVQDNLEILRQKIESSATGSRNQHRQYSDLLTNNKFYALGRRGTGFELNMPDHPIDFKRESNAFIG